MSFWQGNSQPNLSVTGTSTSRHQRPPSGRHARPGSAGRGGSTKSHIFGIDDSPRQKNPDANTTVSSHGNSIKSSSIRTTPEAPRPVSGHPPKKAAGLTSSASVITKSQLDAARNLAKENPNYADQPREVQVFSRSHMGGRKAPQGVPQLDLGNLADDNYQLLEPIEQDGPHLHTPDSNSSLISWGTPLHSSRFHPSPAKPKGGGWQQGHGTQSQKKPRDDVPPLDLKKSQGNDCLQKAFQAGHDENRDVHPDVRFEEKPFKVDTNDTRNLANKHNRPWSTQHTHHESWLSLRQDKKGKFCTQKRRRI